MRVNDLTGRRFGRLTVERRDESHKKGRAYWLCLCDCGKDTIVAGSHLLDGATKSCGCMKIAPTKHGGCTNGKRSRLYGIWHTMISRCGNPNSTGYCNYGGRGILVCDEWMQDYATFRDWAINNGYDDTLSIDRINTNGNYEPSNCRWATKSEQANNTRANVVFEFKDKTLNMKQWSELTGIPYRTLRARISVYGWSIERALTTPVRGR